MNDEPALRLSPACRHDVPEIAALARDRLPEMTHLHDPAWHLTSQRFGQGNYPRDQLFLVLRAVLDDGREELVGFVWVDPAMATDHGVEEPWWCINALAVAEPYAHQGLGASLVASVEKRARDVGVVSLYGQSYETSADFWRKCGYSLTGLGGVIASQGPVPVPGREPNVVALNAEPHLHYFVKQVPESQGVRLMRAQYES
ncbi:GNAT family N-acetyltransferase [Oerskovia merdavium]|uniref:GNAT family N-acetyltransferase n=1 Tax=Oerskovia merdavium TaxID=2762227 RepID=A0ABR8U4V6_9CELL|nr:GNAT family N-acetyltransferase [Oerskovia merdavium]MBD7982785.1 GNAT family N-acetyltransferase [Oerskovia merdavium]